MPRHHGSQADAVRRGPNTPRVHPGIRLAVVALSVALTLGWALPIAAQAAANPCDSGLMKRIQRTYQDMTSFKAHFEQEDHQDDGRIIVARGEVEYLKPGRMRWLYQPPNEQLLVTDGKTVWLYDPLLDNVTVQPLADLTQGTPLAFLLGVGNLEQDFSCRPYTRPPPHDGLNYLELVPRQPIPALAFIQLGAQPRTDRIGSLRMVDTQGNVRWIRFEDLQTGVTFPAGTFTFKVTADTEVITKGGG